MQVLMIILIIKMVLVLCVHSFMDIQLVQSYFKQKMTNLGSIVGCLTQKEQFKVLKSLVFGKQTLSFINIENAKNDLSFLSSSHNHISIILDADCNRHDVERFLIQCGEQSLFDVKHHWLILTENENYLNTFEDVKLFLNADINLIYSKYVNETKNYTITDVYNQAFTNGGTLKTTRVGFYTPKAGYVVLEKGDKYILRKNMTGVTLRSIIVLPMPFKETLTEYLNSNRHPEINTFNRFHYNLLYPCVKFYNFTPNISVSKSWGYLTAHGTFDGLVGALERDQVDYGSSPLFVRADRAQVMEYGRRTWTLRAAFVFRNPKSLNPVDVFIKPLSTSVWMAMCCIAMCTILFLKFTQILERKKIFRRTDTSWSYLIICFMGIYCQQGIVTTIPFFYSGRIIVLFLLVLSYLIYQFYSASIVSNLLMKPKTFIKTLLDILQSELRVGCEDILYNRDYFLYTTDQSSRELYSKKMIEADNISHFLNPAYGLTLVKAGGYAFHVELATAYPIIQKSFPESSICELKEIQMYRTQPMHSNYQKYSPFRDMFDTCLQRLSQYGVMQKEIEFWHPKKPACLQSSKTIDFNLSIDYFYPVFGILVIGIILSLILLILELHINFIQKNRKKRMYPLYPFTN